MVQELLREAGPPAITLTHAPRLHQALDHLRAGGFKAVLLDLSLPDSEGLDTFTRARSGAPDAPIIVLTGLADEATAVTAVREGAQDYLVKGKVDGPGLYHAIRYAVERCRVEDSLRRSEARYRGLVEGSIQGILIHVNGTVRLANQALATMLGYDRVDAFIGTSLWPFVAPEDRERVAANARARLLGEAAPARYEFRAVRADGAVVWLDCIVSVLVWDGEPAILATMVEVTDRKNAEDALREREERFQQLANTIEEVFFVMDSQVRETLYINPAYERVWGRSRASLHERPASFLEAVDPGDRDALAAYFTRVRHGEDAGDIEFRVIRPDGAIRHVLAHAAPIRNAHGDVYRLAGVAMDLTARKQAEDAVRASERRLRTLFETVNLIVLELDTHGRLSYVNPFFRELTGHTAEEVLGRPWFEFLPSRDRAQMRGVFLEMLGRERHAHYRNPIVTRAGEERMISWHNTIVRDAQGRITGTLSVGEDVTEHAVLEEQFRQAQKMEAVGRLAGGVAHDFNNLLAVILINADLAAATPPPKPDVARDAITDIKRAAEQGAALTRQLLAFGRRQLVSLRPLNLAEDVARTERLLRRLLGEDVELHVKGEPGLGAVLADPTQVEQIIMNLAVNARDAMPQGGRLTIELSNVQLDEKYVATHGTVAPGAYVMLAVGDTGTGMDRETQARIFEPFFTTKEHGRGTGLGLATVYGIVKQCGGDIWVYSEPGAGTTFKIYLPRVAPAASGAPSAAPVPVPEALGGTETILIVEDEDALRSLAQRALERQGYTVLTAPNGTVALELAANHRGPIELVISDVVMPGMGGRPLVEKLQRRYPGLRVLFTSGYTTDEIVRRGVMTSETPFLPKPFGIAELGRKVREVLAAPRTP
jgi:PAS domain S-box-containing protein